MKYQGRFLDVNGGYHTLVVGTGTGDPVSLKFGGSPFVTTMEESDMLYKPVKCQSGTIGLVAVDTNYMFGLYTGDTHGMPVTLYSGQVANPAMVEWVGYVTPSLYDIGYTQYLEELDVDVVDGLSTLEAYKYKPIGGTAGIRSLMEIARHCIAQAGCYSMMWVSNATRLSSTSTVPLWRWSFMSERNFMSQDTNATDGEDDKTYKEVLEAICQWSGVTCVAHGDTVYFLDYDELKANASNYGWLVDVAGGTVTSSVLRGSDYEYIQGTTYAGSSTSLSLDKVYRKFTVRDTLNEYDDVLGDLFENLTNITVEDYNFTHNTGISGTNGEYGAPTGVLNASLDPNGDDRMLISPVSVKKRPGFPIDTAKTIDLLAIKYYKSPNITRHNYSINSGNAETDEFQNSINYTYTQMVHGAFMARMAVHELKETSIPQYLLSGIPITNSIDLLMYINDISDLSFNDYLILINHTTNRITNYTAKPFLEITPNIGASALFGGDNAYIVISGDVIMHNLEYSTTGVNYMFPVPHDQVDIGNATIDGSNCKALCRFQWGPYFWTGSTWTTSNATFWLPFAKKNMTLNEFILNDNGILDCTTFRIGLDVDGYVIPAPKYESTYTNVFFGSPKFDILGPPAIHDDYKMVFMAIKDLKITPCIANPLRIEQDSETVYTNVVGTSNAEDMEEQTFSVCTWDNKKPNFSAVAYVANGGLNSDGTPTSSSHMRFVDTTYHSALHTAETGSTRYDGTTCDGTMRNEEHMLFRLYNQYSEPAKVLKLTLHDAYTPWARVKDASMMDTLFVIDSKSVDYKAQTYTYKLIEKK